MREWTWNELQQAIARMNKEDREKEVKICVRGKELRSMRSFELRTISDVEEVDEVCILTF